MITAMLILAAIIITITFILITNSNKLFFMILFAVTLIATIGICIVKPDIHKQFSINVIDYLIKFNNDGSMTTTKQTTTTIIKEDKK